MLYRVAFLILCLFVAAYAAPTVNTDRDGKIFHLFSIVRFQNTPCTTTGNQNGVCLSSKDCSNAKGTGSGTCGSGFGVCCLIEASCGASISKNCSYFAQQNYNSAEECRATVKIPKGSCQVKLDIVSMTLSQPAAANGAVVRGTCSDTFEVLGADQRIPTICGTNNDQHMYIGVEGKSSIDLVVTPGSTGAKNWRVKVTYIECDSSERAPPGCLQYFRESMGEIKSFNADATPPLHLINQEYSICFRKHSGMCSVTATQRANDFFLISGAIAESQQVNGNCLDDHLHFLGIVGASRTAGRLCGGILNQADAQAATAAVESRGFQYNVRFSNLEGPAAQGAGGFKLGYSQNSC